MFSLFFMQLQNFYHIDGHKTVEKGRWLRTTEDPEEGPEALNCLETTGVGQQLQLFKALGHCPRREQSEQLPMVKTC